MKVIKRNAIRCLKCGDVIESKYTHDFKECSCKSCFIDGGTEYARIGGNPENYEVMTEYEEVPGYHVTYWTHYGMKGEFHSSKNVNDIISIYEDQWYLLRIQDENDNIIYESNELGNFLKRQMKG